MILTLSPALKRSDLGESILNRFGKSDFLMRMSQGTAPGIRHLSGRDATRLVPDFFFI